MADFLETSQKSHRVPLQDPNSSKIQVECPENVEMGGKIDSIRVCVAPSWKAFLRYLSYLCTGFIMFLFNVWLPQLHVKMTLIDSTPESAEWVVVYGADRKIEIVKLERETTSKGKLLVFTYRLFKYYFDDHSKIFRPAQFNIERMTCNDIHIDLGHGLDEKTVEDNGVFYGKNITDIPRKSCISLFLEEIMSPFYVFQVYSCIIWIIDDYTAYSLVIFIFSAISIIMALVDTLRTTNKLRTMSYYEIPVHVFRVTKGERQKMIISSSELVPGDLIEIPEGVSMPCDAILLNGSCIMNEAMLTGESIPVVKNALPRNDNLYSLKDDKQYTLYAGTKCIQARFNQGTAVLGLVTLTGFSTVKGELIRTMLFPKPSDFKFYSDSFKFIGCLGVAALAGFLIDLPKFLELYKGDHNPETLKMLIIKASEIVTVTVPPALPTCLHVGISIALGRLKKRETYCISPNKINEAGRINVMCFDKTGTLTEDGLDLLGVRSVCYDSTQKKLNFSKVVRNTVQLFSQIDPKDKINELENYIRIESQSQKNNLYSTTKLFPSEQLLEIMASCHSLSLVNNTLIGDPLDIKMFESTRWTYEENENQKFDAQIIAAVKNPTSSPSQKREIGIIRRFEFSSKLQRMSVIVKNLADPNFRMYIKGSPEKIQELCDPASIPDNFHSTLQKYTEEGYRVLACGSKSLGSNYRDAMSVKREDVENDFNFIGFLIMENKIKPITTSIIDQLHGAEIRTIMVTGDNVLTAISVARQCHIINQYHKIFLGDIIESSDGSESLTWTDFKFSDQKLTESLEITHDTSRNSVKNDSAVLSILEGGANPISEFDPPFLNLYDQDDYCIAVTGKAFNKILHEAEVNGNPKYGEIFQKMLKKCAVYARMHPDEKALMIKHLMTIRRNTVGMCGDGANDVGALKTANVGVSLSEAEASIAAPFTSKIQDISCIPRLLMEGRSALATSYQAFKYMALYSVIQSTSVTILYYHIIEFTNTHYYHIDMGLILPMAATMALSGTYEHLTKFIPTGRLISVEILTSVIGQAIIQAGFQIYTFAVMKDQSDFKAYTGGFSNQQPTYENTTLYLISLYQYLTVALVFLVGRPFRKPFYTNFFFTVTFIVMLCVNLLMTFNPLDLQFIYLQPGDLSSGIAKYRAELSFSHDWRIQLFNIALVNSIVTIAWERIVVKITATVWRQHRINQIKQERVSVSARKVYFDPKNETTTRKSVTELSIRDQTVL